MRLFTVFGIAKCQRDLGDPVKAARTLRAHLRGHRPDLKHWAELRAFGKCEELLALCILDEQTKLRIGHQHQAAAQ